LTGGGSGFGWNLVSNPYTSAIDWDASGWNKTNIRNEFRLRTNGNYVYYNGNSVLALLILHHQALFL